MLFSSVEKQLALGEAFNDDAYSIWIATVVVPPLRHGGPGIVTKEELRWEGPASWD